jgi:1,6-anhydro-N-acetylmuramate kinase
MSKRLAQTQLTPEELAKNLDEDADQKQNLDAEDGLATLDELKDRKIIKVKRKIVPE